MSILKTCYVFGCWVCPRNIQNNLQIKQPTRCTLNCKIFYCLNAAQHVLGNFCPSSGALLNCSRSCGCSSKILLMMGKIFPKHVEQLLNNKRFYNWVYIWLVVLFEDLKMHGTTNHKFKIIFKLSDKRFRPCPSQFNNYSINSRCT
jgi:hypothetical protein